MKKKNIVVTALLVALACVTYAGCGKKEEEPTTENNTEVTTDGRMDSKVVNAKYADETDYRGGNVPYQLYDNPFQQSDYYIPNVELTEKVLDSEIEEYIKSAERYVQLVFGNNARTIARDPEGFRKEYKDFYEIDREIEHSNEEPETVSDRANKLVEWYVDNKIVCEAEFNTDRSLLYCDNNMLYYLRGELVLTFIGENEGETVPGLKDLYGIEAEYGVPVHIMTEFEFVPTEYDKVSGLRLIKYIE